MCMVSLVAQSMLINVYLSVLLKYRVELYLFCFLVLNKLQFRMAAKMQFQMSRTYLINTYFYVHGIIGGAKYANYVYLSV